MDISRSLLLLITLICSGRFLSAQEGSLTAIMEEVGKTLELVETNKYRYEQRLDYGGDRPWEAILHVTEINQKNDRSETTTYTLNLADLDPRLVNYEDDRDEQLVVLKTRGRQEFILAREGDDEGEYDSELRLWSSEIDRAKELRDLFRKAIPLAEAAWAESFTPGDNLAGLQAWLTEYVVPVETDGNMLEPSWGSGEPSDDRVTYALTDADEGSTDDYRFSLADIARNTVEVKVHRGTVAVTMGTVGNEDLIERSDEAGSREFVDQLEIPVSGVDDARRLMQSLEATLSLAKEARDARLLRPEDLSTGLRHLADLVSGTSNGEDRLEAALEPDPVTTLEVEATDGDSEATSHTYRFSFADLDPGKLGLSTRRGLLYVTARARGGADFIQSWENGEPEGFENEVAFPVPSTEEAIQLRSVLPSVIGWARELPVDVRDFAWLQDAVTTPPEDDMAQELMMQPDTEDACKWVYLRTESGRKTQETRYEFNLYDLESSSVEVDIRGGAISLELPTRSREKIINVYQDNEPSFTDSMQWRFSTLPQAREAAATLEALIGGCTK